MSRKAARLDYRPGLKWAVLGYHRWWMTYDQPELLLMRLGGRRYDPQSVRRVAKRYSVNRRLRKGDDSAAKLAGLLNDALPEWEGKTLVERAKICRRLACEAESVLEITEGQEISLISKLMWFLCPEGWTMFDDLAAKGAGFRYGTAVSRSEGFYTHLETVNFASGSREGNDLIGAAGFAFPMERVFDQQLWLCGLDPPRLKTDLTTFAAYLFGLPSDWRARLVALADVIASKIQPIPTRALQEHP